MKLNITDRTSYLLFVSDWKAAYKKLSASTRQYNLALKTQSRTNQAIGRLYFMERFGNKSVDQQEIKKLEDERHAANLSASTAYQEVTRIQKLLPNHGDLAHHCRAGELSRYPAYGGFPEIANYMLALRKEGKRLAQIAWKKEHAAPKPELVAA